MNSNDYYVIENEYYNKEKLLLHEATFALSNGYIGIRGSFEEEYPNDVLHLGGTILNNFYDLHYWTYPEKTPGLSLYSEQILLPLNSEQTKIFFNDEEFNLFKLDQKRIIKYKRYLDMKKGELKRLISFKTLKNEIINIIFSRIVSFHTKELFIQKIEISSDDFKGRIRLAYNHSFYISTINEKTKENEKNIHDDFVIDQTEIKQSRIDSTISTKNTKIKLKQVSYLTTNQTPKKIEKNNQDVFYKIEFEKNLIITKYNFYFNNVKVKNNDQYELLINKTIKNDYDFFLKEQEQILEKFWEISDIDIDFKNNDNKKTLSALRFNLFSLFQNAPSQKRGNIAAKGLTGLGYHGHYFWDSEIYMLPFFISTNPQIAKKFLLFRFATLDKAKEIAKHLNYQGALYPWRTISGVESSGYFLTSTAQFHINGAIAYAIIKYIYSTDDYQFLIDYGFEMLFEIARFISSVVNWNSEKKYYEIFAVTGPDEYTCLINNNFYTNIIFKYTLEELISLINSFKNNTEINQILKKFNVSETELLKWNDISKKIYLPITKNKIIMQDDSFMSKPKFDYHKFEKPLYKHVHYLTLYNHQVAKQADAVLALYLLDKYLDPEIIKNTYNYYDESIVTNDSSLSGCIYAIVGFHLKDFKKGLDYFHDSINLDLEDLQLNGYKGLIKQKKMLIFFKSQLSIYQKFLYR